MASLVRSIRQRVGPILPQEALEVRQIDSGTAWEAAASIVYWGHALTIRAEVQPIFVGRSGDELRFSKFS